MREFAFAKKWNIVVIMRNEVGNSLPIELGRLNCQQFFASLIREIENEIPNIPQSSWKGYVFMEKT